MGFSAIAGFTDLNCGKTWCAKCKKQTYHALTDKRGYCRDCADLFPVEKKKQEAA